MNWSRGCQEAKCILAVNETDQYIEVTVDQVIIHFLNLKKKIYTSNKVRIEPLSKEKKIRLLMYKQTKITEFMV